METNNMYMSDSDMEMFWGGDTSEDVIVVNPAPANEKVPAGTTNADVTDEDLYEFGDEDEDTFDFNDIDDNEKVELPADEEQLPEDESDDEEEVKTEYEEFNDFDLDDEVLIDMGEELGNVSFGEMRENYLTKQVLDQHIEEVKNQYADIESKRSGLDDVLTLSKLEVDKELESYANVNWARMKSERPNDYYAHKEYYDNLLTKRSRTEQALESHKAHLAEQAEIARRQKAQEALIILKRDIPGFSRELINEILAHAIEDLGASEDVQDETNPATIKAYYNSMLRKKGVNQLATKKLKKKVRVAKPITSGKVSKGSGSKSSARASQALKNGDMNSTILFDSLED